MGQRTERWDTSLLVSILVEYYKSYCQIVACSTTYFPPNHLKLLASAFWRPICPSRQTSLALSPLAKG